MSASDVVGANIMDVSAALLNDSAKSVYTYAAQSPYLRLALQELREIFELNNIPVTQSTSAVIQIDAGVTLILYNASGTSTNPKLPDDMEGIQTSEFIYYTWNSQQIEVLPSTQNNDIKIDYIKQMFPNANATVDQTTQINVVNCMTFLQFRVAALCAEFIERNESTAQAQNSMAVLALDRATGIGVKGKQNIQTRRRPFRAAYKRRGYYT